jgi:tRNA (pseudouridine54-N1)-methyltransferase
MKRARLPAAMRRFATVSHTGRSDGAWRLDDLPGSAGRIDVLCRNLQSALFLSHGLRDDVEAFAVFVGATAADRGRTVRIQGGAIQRLNPDERSTAARLQQALQTAWTVPDWKEVQRGLSVAGFGLEGLLDDLAGRCTPVLLDPKGTPIEEWQAPKDPLFLLSDHTPFTPAEYALLDGRGVERVSLGPHWYHGNHAISVVQWWLDRKADAAK